MSTPIFIFETDTYENTSGQNNIPFTVVSFTGREGISELFEFKITIKVSVSYASYFSIQDDEVATTTPTIMEDNAIFKMSFNGVVKKFEGMVSEFQDNGSEVVGFKNYEVVLVPWLYKETQNVRSQVYSSPSDNLLTIDTILTREFDDVCGSLHPGSSYIEKFLIDSYEGRPFTCQYKESNLNFISRLMEKYGIYYHYVPIPIDSTEPMSNKFKVHDDKNYDDLMPLVSSTISTTSLILNPTAAGSEFYSTIKTKVQKNKKIPSCVTISQFDPDQPSLKISKTYPEGRDNRYSVTLNENVLNENEAMQLAKIRYEELLCHSRLISGESGFCLLTPGFTVDVEDVEGTHNLLITEVEHTAKNLDFTSISASDMQYKNNYVAIDATKQFRPKRLTPLPNVNNTETGTVYADQVDPRYAEIDDEGRYRIEFNFIDHSKDVSSSSGDEDKRKVSYWLRKAESAAGLEDGLIIPLKPGVEVTLSFLGGDPDLPIIAAALSNASFPASVTATNPNHALINTSGLLGLKANGGFYQNVKTETDIVRDTDADFDFPVFDPASPFRSTTHSNPAALDNATEMSGGYLIDRAYGDEYEYRHGYSFRYLDNEKEYVIGRTYLEEHAKDASNNLIDYENINVLTISSHEFPDDIRTPECLPIVKIDDDTTAPPSKRMPGIVEKTWGDTFEYYKGTVHTWSDCDEVQSDGETPLSYNGGGRTINHGQGMTYNFFDEGVDYEEPTKKAVAGADWLGQANAAIANNIYIPSLSTAMSKFIGDAEKKKNNPFHDITYTTGDTLDNHVGNEINIHTGFTGELIFGDSMIVTRGSSAEVFVGDSNWFFSGMHNETILGLTTTHHVGFKVDNFVGGLEEVVLGVHLQYEVSVGHEFNSTWKTRTDKKKDDIAAQASIAVLKLKEDVLKKSLTCLDNDIKALNHRVDAANVNIKAATKITLITATINVTAVMIKLG